MGVKLPDEYIAFLSKYNGGHPEKDTFDLIQPVYNDLKRGKTAGVDRFLALYDGYYDNLEKEYIGCEDTDFFPIACTEGNDRICLCIKGKNYCKVYYWDFIYSGEEIPTYDNLYLIANSFTDFINSLYEYDIEEDKSDKDIAVSIHDKYSLPTSHYIKTYGKVITNFFDKAPKNVKKFIIKEFTANGDLFLSFKSGNKEYFRRLNKNGKIIEES